MQNEMTVTGNQARVRLVGSMYVEDAAKLREELLEKLQQGVRSVTIDMRELNYIDSSGLGVLVAVNSKMRASGGEVILSGLKGVVADVFQRTRLTKVFKIVN